jgi:small neutral amino acid transporter SnatA (MarC family)
MEDDDFQIAVPDNATPQSVTSVIVRGVAQRGAATATTAAASTTTTAALAGGQVIISPLPHIFFFLLSIFLPVLR